METTLEQKGEKILVLQNTFSFILHRNKWNPKAAWKGRQNTSNVVTWFEYKVHVNCSKLAKTYKATDMVLKWK